MSVKGFSGLCAVAIIEILDDWLIMQSFAGPASTSELHLRSFRSKEGLTALVKFHPQCQAFPGIVHGGAVSTLFECQGNWTAAIALMDRGQLSRPPLTLTKEILVCYLRSAGGS